MYGDTLESSENSFTKVFMQLMCPSCCGGLFSETKGSVYMKRKSTVRKSETNSATMTVCSEIDDNVKIELSSTRASERRTHSPILEESTLKSSSEDGETSQGRTEQSNRTTEPSILFANNASERRVTHDETVEEEMNVLATHGVLHKNRSMSLSETINSTIHEELGHAQQNDDDHNAAKWYNNKLRKTSFPNGNGNFHPKNNQTIGLKIGGKEYVEIQKCDDGNEPPFNFQAVLRKTNSNRQSLRRSSDLSENLNYEQSNFMVELFPGIVLKGIVYDL